MLDSSFGRGLIIFRQLVHSGGERGARGGFNWKQQSLLACILFSSQGAANSNNKLSPILPLHFPPPPPPGQEQKLNPTSPPPLRTTSASSRSPRYPLLLSEGGGEPGYSTEFPPFFHVDEGRAAKREHEKLLSEKSFPTLLWGKKEARGVLESSVLFQISKINLNIINGIS